MRKELGCQAYVMYLADRQMTVKFHHHCCLKLSTFNYLNHSTTMQQWEGETKGKGVVSKDAENE